MTVDGDVEGVIGDNEQQDVGQKDISEFHVKYENHHDVEGGKQQGEGEDGCQCLMLGHARAHQLVVDVVFVGVEKGAAIAQADKHHANHVKHRGVE